jgi:exodeoxyribonuclease VII large subunit
MSVIPHVPILPAAPRVGDDPSDKGVSLSHLLARLQGVVQNGMPEAIWVRAEISKADTHGGHMYLDFSERGDDGKVVAKCRGMIWNSAVQAIQAKFTKATGGPLKKDIKILCKGRVKFYEYHGISIHIEDVDPSYTLGDLTLRLAQIRRQLNDEGIAEKNRCLHKPTEFVRVAIISPKSSAGLGDFRREADYLQQNGLCHFSYFTASFQGPETANSIKEALRLAYEEHQSEPFDALAIIRGGGAATDLAWLNEYALAKWVCRIPIPVFTGIGHKQDSTILDEVAHTSFDTPSKVVLHIVGVIWNNAAEAFQSYERIRDRAEYALTKWDNALATQAAKVKSGVAASLNHAANACETRQETVRTSAEQRALAASSDLAWQHDLIANRAEGVVNWNAREVKTLAMLARERSLSRLSLAASTIERQARAVLRESDAAAVLAAAAVSRAGEMITDNAASVVSLTEEKVVASVEALNRGAVVAVDAAERSVDSEAKTILASGPEATLRRGFALARSEDGQPLTRRVSALPVPAFRLQFHDGELRVSNLDRGRSDE